MGTLSPSPQIILLLRRRNHWKCHLFLQSCKASRFRAPWSSPHSVAWEDETRSSDLRSMALVRDWRWCSHVEFHPSQPIVIESSAFSPKSELSLFSAHNNSPLSPNVVNVSLLSLSERDMGSNQCLSSLMMLKLDLSWFEALKGGHSFNWRLH